MLPISIYIHIPFCFSRCPYCSFLSFTNFKDINMFQYIKSIIKDFKKYFFLKKYKRYIDSIYIGGGTPNILNIQYISFLLENIFLNFLCKKNIEITLEVNILNLDFKSIFNYYKIGINRLSLGIQSFNNSILKSIGRNYSCKYIYKMINIVKYYFKNFNVDLIYGLPNQTVNDAIKDIKNIIKLNIPHLSWYELMIKKNTKFYNILNNYDYSKTEKIFFRGRKILKENGYFQYEISSYVKKKKYFCLHNINYWCFGDYLGFGCGAHSKITMLNYKYIYRIIKVKNILKYMKEKYIQKIFFLSVKDIIAEYFICRLRFLIPFCISDFVFYTGLKFNFVKKKIYLAVKKRYLFFLYKENKFFLTRKGFLFLNDCLEIFC